MSNAFDDVGGLEGLRVLLRDFYSRVYTDPMIGFMFQPIDRETLIEREAQFTARLLGARDVTYTGRPMRQAHARHRIMGGHFARRQQLLREVLRDHDVAEHVQRPWLEHSDSLRPQITADVGRDCGPRADAEPAPAAPKMLDPFEYL